MSESLQAVREEVKSRLAVRQREHDAAERADGQMAAARGLTFVAAIVAAYVARSGALVPTLITVALGLVFVTIVVLHARLLRRMRRAARAVAHYERSVARLDDAWSGKGNDGARYADPAHPYARDLDLFGSGSLFQLLSSARSRAGEDHLARLLTAPAAAEEVRARQAAVRELAPLVDLREALALAGDEVKDELDLSAIAKWAEQAPAPISIGWAIAWLATSLSALGALVAWSYDRVPGLVPLALLITLAFMHLQARAAVARATRALGRAEQQLALLAELFALLESNRGQAARLQTLHERLGGSSEKASRAIAWLGQLVAAYHWPQNLIMVPFGAMFLWQPQVARAIEAWRIAHGPAILGWLAALGEWEALVSLAAYAWENPTAEGHVWPELREGVALAATDLGHPLLPRARCVRNDFAIGGDAPSLYVVSGSNMSGKSTFLRTIGTNVVLALAGAPVRARTFVLSPLQLAASLRSEDSLADGVSRFYAEVKRLALVQTLAEQTTVLFLIDEALSGTNSHDRRIGAAALAKTLIETGAIGLVTTHDLALAALADELPRTTNVHFADDTASGAEPDARPRFDYRLHVGPIDPARSNALRLMRSAGLRV